MTTHQQKSKRVLLRISSVFRNPSLTVEARFLWGLLELYSGPNGSSSFPSQDRLAREAGHSRTWVKKYIKELGEKGFLEVNKRRTNSGWANSYDLQIAPK